MAHGYAISRDHVVTAGADWGGENCWPNSRAKAVYLSLAVQDDWAVSAPRQQIQMAARASGPGRRQVAAT
eukprot:6177121-Pleurochrysis_carterae.AAC.4